MGGEEGETHRRKVQDAQGEGFPAWVSSVDKVSVGKDRKTPICFGNKPAVNLQISVSGRCRRSPGEAG